MGSTSVKAVRRTLMKLSPDRVLLERNAETSLRAHPEAGLVLPARSLQFLDDPVDRVEHLLHLPLDRRRHLETRWQ